MDPYGNTQNGWTALTYAAFNDQEGCVSLLVEAGADGCIEDKEGSSALDYAKTESIRAILRC